MEHSKAEFTEEELADIRENCAKEYQELLMHVSNPIFIILQGHMYIEMMMDRYLISELPKGNIIVKDGNLSFKQKLILVQSIGIVEQEVINGVKALNALRNKLVHRFSHPVTTQQIESIGLHFPETYQRIKENHGDCPANVIKLLMTFVIGCMASQAHFSEAIASKNNKIIC